MEQAERLLAALDGAVSKAMGGDVAIMFSGGLDSGILAGLTRRHGRPRLYTVGVEGSHDLRMSEEAAALLDLPWEPMVMTEDDILEACREVLTIATIDHPVVLSFELPLQMIARRVPEEGLMSGQGADELFAGYNRYLEMAPEQLEAAMLSDIQHVLDDGAPLDRAISSHYGKTIHHPFLDPEVRKVAGEIPAADMIAEGVRKAPLREVARLMGLDLIADREKKAAQYGSGFMKVLKARARKEGLSLKDYMVTLGPPR